MLPRTRPLLAAAALACALAPDPSVSGGRLQERHVNQGFGLPVKSAVGGAWLVRPLEPLPQAGGRIPAHPRELKYPRLDFTPPEASKYRHVLAGGPVAFLVEDHQLPLVTVSVVVRTGSYRDPQGKEGLASAVGNLLRSGGTRRFKAEEFDDEVEFLAANISSFAGATSAGATLNCLAKDVDRGLELYFEMLREPAFQQDRIDLLKSQSLQQMERRNDRTDAIEGREWNRLLRGDRHFSSRLPTKASVEAIGREDLVAFHRRAYHPGSFVFAVSGDFKTADMKVKLERALAGWPGGGEPAPAVPKPEHRPEPGIYAVRKTGVNQGRVSLGHLGILRGDPDEYALELMNEILGGSGFTARIMARIRSEEGLAYDASSVFSPGIYYEGQFRALFQSKNTTVLEAAQILLEEIERIRREKVKPDELETVKNSAVETFPRNFSSAAAVAGTFASDEHTRRDPRFWQTYRDRIRAVTVDDVLRVAQKHLHPEALVILIVGDDEAIARGNPDRPQYSWEKLTSGRKVTRIPLPDPLTMTYPKP